MSAERRQDPERCDPAGIPSTGLLGTLAVYGATGVLFYLATDRLLPVWAAHSSLEPVLLWFLVAGLGVFPALLVAAWAVLRREDVQEEATLWRRLRFRAMTRSDWSWTLGGLIAIGVSSGLLLAVVTWWSGAALSGPWFLEMEPLAGSRLWILAVWIPFFVLNILVEEIVWRGVLLPRQQVALGRWAWAANGAGWLLMHLAFGTQILLMLLPIVIVLPFVTQTTRNSWCGVVMHAALNGPGFLATAFGWL